MFKKGISNVVVWLNVLFIILALCTEGYLFIFEEFSILNIIYGCLDIVLLVESFLYLITGRKKSSAGYFKAYSMLFAIRILINAMLTGGLINTYQAENMPAFSGILTNVFNVLPLAPATMIATCKDLGRKKSFTIVGIIYAIYIIGFILALVRPLGHITTIDKNVFLYIARPGLQALEASLLGIMVVEKYQDKASRNTD